MNFTLPTASRKRLEELLTLLGNRAEDFKKCFDIESKWCWKYADLALRGLYERNLVYAEEHHIVPASFYGNRRRKSTDYHNVTTLTFQEHLYAHFCLAFCSIGTMKGKMSCAFHYMFNVGQKTSKLYKEDDVLAYISSKDLELIKLEIPVVKKVTEDGRHHKWEVSADEYNKEIYHARRDKKSETNKALYRRTKAKKKKYNKKYYKENKDTLSLKNKSYYNEHKEQINARSRKYHADHRDDLNIKSREYYAANAEHLREYARNYSATHREERKLKERARREHNRDEYNERARKRYADNCEAIKKRQREYSANHREELKLKARNYRAAKKAAGYRLRNNPLTGKKEWVFVGRPEMKFNEQQLSATGT